MSNFFSGLLRVLGRVLGGAVFGAILLVLAVNGAFSIIDAAMGTDMMQVTLGAALIGGVGGAILGLLYSWKRARSAVETVAQAVLESVV